MHGDGLTVANYSNLELKVARRGTEIGRENYVDTHLKALRRVKMQKGLFHELMHHSDGIYKKFYGGFLQPLQTHCAVKRVTGDPTKNHYQDHDHHLDLCDTSSSRFHDRMFVLHHDASDFVVRDGESNRQFLLRVEEMWMQFTLSYETSLHQPSKMISLFLKQQASYKRQKHAMRACDFWIVEKEQCELLTLWRQCNKTTYLKEQCEHIEKFYADNFSIEDREMMRRNAFCVLSDRGRGCAFDEVCELYNLHIKQTNLSNDLSVNVERSAHVQLERSCAMEIFNTSTKSKSFKSSRDVDVNRMEQYLFKCGVFQSHESVAMDNTYFWQHVVKPKNVGTQNDKCHETVPLTSHEMKLKENLCTSAEASGVCDSSILFDGDDDDIASVASSCVGEPERDNMDVENPIDDNGDGDEETKEDGEKVGNLRKRDFNPLSLKDHNSVENKAACKKSIVKNRAKAIARRQRQLKMIELAVSFFKHKMEERRSDLKENIAKSVKGEYKRDLLDFEKKYKLIRQRRRSTMHRNV